MNPVARLMTTNGDAIVVVIPVPTVAAVPEDVVLLVLIPSRLHLLPEVQVAAVPAPEIQDLVQALEVQGLAQTLEAPDQARVLEAALLVLILVPARGIIPQSLPE